MDDVRNYYINGEAKEKELLRQLLFYGNEGTKLFGAGVVQDVVFVPKSRFYPELRS